MRSRIWAEPLYTNRTRFQLLVWLRCAIARLDLCMQIRAERKALAKLTDHQLQDIGIHRADAIAECQRSWLDLPQQRQVQLQAECERD